DADPVCGSKRVGADIKRVRAVLGRVDGGADILRSPDFAAKPRAKKKARRFILSHHRQFICMIIGTGKPSAFAVLRLITSFSLVDCWNGRLAGFAPLSICPASLNRARWPRAMEQGRLRHVRGGRCGRPHHETKGEPKSRRTYRATVSSRA